MRLELPGEDDGLSHDREHLCDEGVQLCQHGEGGDAEQVVGRLGEEGGGREQI